MKCAICFRKARKYSHHICTRGSGGCDCPENLLPLCWIHHAEVHASSNADFYDEYNIPNLYMVAVRHRNIRNQGLTECAKKLKGVNKK
jgi:hypothetical protein